MKNNQGFTLIELIVVIVILGILAVTAAPKFLNLQTDAHKSLMQGVYGSFNTALDLYHTQWLVEGEPDLVTGYANGKLYANAAGYPVSDKDDGNVYGEGCKVIFESLIDTDITLIAEADKSNANVGDIIYHYTGDARCYYSYLDNNQEITTIHYDPSNRNVTIDFPK
ncbi:type II secretion system protein [Aliivibrio sp. SR45-2]|uniref:type II secretion system protein n=1 Tax=Aliivibrio sp. SR45-2 TaxID=2760931 RepID=UPI0015FB3C87|nr:type II secretion system protein [Aliivibrio sp. SR45-2]MBB1312467.1 type II secretion system protein [Aliivibrio sp. SR45-2]